MANDAILTKENLIKYNCLIDGFCIRCQGEIESMEYLFLLCPSSKCIWEAFLDAFKIITPLKHNSDCWVEWRIQYVKGRSQKTWDMIVAATLWYICFNRNNRCFRAGVMIFSMLFITFSFLFPLKQVHWVVGTRFA